MSSETLPLRDFLATVTGRLSGEDRELIASQAIVLLDQLYAHLPLKRARFAADPLVRLSLLRRRAASLGEVAFHREMLAIFNGLRDLHTLYTLPEPFRSKVAFLPLLVEEHFEGDEPRYALARLARGAAEDPDLVPGVEITHWNAVPIRRAVELHGERAAGGNEAANRAIGIYALTQRSLGHDRWPDEEWVVIGYRARAGAAREVRFPWRVADLGYSFAEDGEVDAPEALCGGLSRPTEVARRLQSKLFAPRPGDDDEPPASASGAISLGAGPGDVETGVPSLGGAPGSGTPDVEIESRLPANLSARVVRTPHGEHGYLRIWSFEDRSDSGTVEGFIDGFVAEVRRLLGSMPATGMILDVRGNPGGRIPAGERILELFSPIPITPARFHFRSTPLVQELCRLAPKSLALDEWRGGVDEAIETGSITSLGLPFQPFARAYNEVGQEYHGPVVLIVDALSYSTTDIFAAGFQDHGIGPVLGTDVATGAGGANGFTHEVLVKLLSRSSLSRLTPLPGGATFTVALRQSTRVGPRAGVILEDAGVTPDHIHRPTRRDLFERNADLVTAAAALLAERKIRALSAVPSRGRDGALALAVTTRGLTRLDVYADDRPRLSVDVTDGLASLTVPGSAAPRTVELRGFDGDAQVARRLLRIQPDGDAPG